jgi:hypothetical protein
MAHQKWSLRKPVNNTKMLRIKPSTMSTAHVTVPATPAQPKHHTVQGSTSEFFEGTSKREFYLPNRTSLIRPSIS